MGRLARAQGCLQRRQCPYQLAVFDAWRPVAVQAFMVNHAIRQECEARGLDPDGSGPEWEAVGLDVGRFWAPPSLHPAAPPPHSTGAAVDLTLADAAGQPLEMGGAIDAIGPVSEPDHYALAAREEPDSEAALWHGRRRLLAAVMQEVGFVQHPNEWWHFSYGDQLWAWRRGLDRAYYGRIGAPAPEG
jgi:D-alanyl-D-alanine dipeptidase